LIEGGKWGIDVLVKDVDGIKVALLAADKYFHY
jgi:hypothetical protein